MSERTCTCLGACKGKEGLAPGWRCALEDKPPAREHKPLCEGHIDCPNCGPDSCARPVVVEMGLGGMRADRVVCLGCRETFGVEHENEHE